MITLFLRDVRSQLHFEQMKGCGTRTAETSSITTFHNLN